MSRFRTQWLKVTVIATIAVLGGGLLHNVVSLHARCAEHGEWVDADDVPAPVGLGQEQLADGDAIKTFEHRALVRGAHEHCAVATAQHRPTTASRPLLALNAVPPSALQPKRTPPAPGASSLPPIKVAPKQSPPLA